MVKRMTSTVKQLKALMKCCEKSAFSPLSRVQFEPMTNTACATDRYMLVKASVVVDNCSCLEDAVYVFNGDVCNNPKDKLNASMLELFFDSFPNFRGNSLYYHFSSFLKREHDSFQRFGCEFGSVDPKLLKRALDVFIAFGETPKIEVLNLMLYLSSPSVQVLIMGMR